jgi:hypothetical protein
MRLFAFEVYMGEDWTPRSFFTGTYREVIETLGDTYTAASRLRRVRSREEYQDIERRVEPMSIPGLVSTVALSPDSLKEDIEWVE